MRFGNPNVYYPGVIEVEHWQVTHSHAYRLRLEDRDENGNIRPRSQLVRRPGDDIRYYPDEQMWPGSILEFL